MGAAVADKKPKPGKATMKANLKIDPETHRKLKVLAAMEKKHIEEYFEQLLGPVINREWAKRGPRDTRED